MSLNIYARKYLKMNVYSWLKSKKDFWGSSKDSDDVLTSVGQLLPGTASSQQLHQFFL